MKQILLTNDDGIDAAGIKTLERILNSLGKIRVVAPASEKSGASHSLTIGKPVKIEERDLYHTAIYGTPTDCVLLAHHSLMKGEIDIVVSGINIGYNLADDVLYSGTVAAAMEGRILRYPAVAVSGPRDHFQIAKASLDFVHDLCKMLIDCGQLAFLNVNLPIGEPKGVQVTRLGKRIYKDVVDKKMDENGEWHLILSGEMCSVAMEGSDTEAVEAGFISVTPMHLDLTAYEDIDELFEDLQELDSFRLLNNLVD